MKRLFDELSQSDNEDGRLNLVKEIIQKVKNHKWKLFVKIWQEFHKIEDKIIVCDIDISENPFWYVRVKFEYWERVVRNVKYHDLYIQKEWMYEEFISKYK